MSGGGGSSSSKQTIADYAMSIHYGVCYGPVDEINRIRINDKDLGIGAMSANQTVTIDNRSLFGGWRKNGGVAGKMDVMFGGPTQMVTPALAERLGRTPETCPGFRGITTLFFHSGKSPSGKDVPLRGFYWSSNFPTIPPVDVTVTRYPVGPNGEKVAGPNGLANPAHIIFECLTNHQWAMASPIGLIDIPSFQAAANTLISENFWLGMMWTRSDTIENFVGEVLDHIQASLGPDPSTGKWSLRLLREDYDRDNLFLVHPGNAEVTRVQRKLWGETGNEVSVTYTNPDNEEEESITVHDDANIAAQGQIVNSSRNYYGVRDPNLAARLAMRDLRQSATPLLAVDVEVDRSAWKLKPGDVCELRWPYDGIGTCIMRVGDIDYGTGGDSRIKTTLVEDIFGAGDAVFTELYNPQPGDPAPVYPPPRPGQNPQPPDVVTPLPPQPQPPEWTDTDEDPRALDYYWLNTAPYFMLARLFGDQGMDTFSYPTVSMITLVSQGGRDTSTIGRWTKTLDVTGNELYTLQVQIPTMRRGLLAEAIDPAPASTLPPLTNTTGTPTVSGDYVVFVDPADPNNHEIGAVETMFPDESFTVRRASMDTIPRAWPVGTIVYTFDGSNQTPFDLNLHADGDEVDYKFTPNTSRGAFDINVAPEVTVEAGARPYLPYRPANFAINGDLWSVPVPNPGDNIALSWSRRNRITETGQILRWTDADVTPEAGQTTSVIVLRDDGSTLLRVDGLTGTTYNLVANDIRDLEPSENITVKLVAVRDGFESLMGAERIVNATNIAYQPGYGEDYGINYGGAL